MSIITDFLKRKKYRLKMGHVQMQVLSRPRGEVYARWSRPTVETKKRTGCPEVARTTKSHDQYTDGSRERTRALREERRRRQLLQRFLTLRINMHGNADDHIDTAKRANRNLTINTICTECDGWGVKTYPNTATWRDRPGMVSGQAFSQDVCDKCWGSGDHAHPWPSHREFSENKVKLKEQETKLKEVKDKNLTIV